MSDPTGSSTSSTSLSTPSQSPPPGSTDAPPTTPPPPSTPPPASSTPPDPPRPSSSSAPASSSSSSPPTSAPPSSSESTSSSPAIPTSSSTLVITRTSGTAVVIVTSTIPVASPTRGIAAPSPSSGGSRGFLNNKGAMAGVFTVAGLVIVAVLVAIMTNVVRRRRAHKFDREIAEAAREAAAAQAPAFLDDDAEDHGYGAGGYGAKGAGMVYSDASSHGTYAQPPMAYESYNMSEFQPMDGYNPAGRGGVPMSDAGMVGAGAAGVGASALARARSYRNAGDEYAEGPTPYPAFAGPGGVQPEETYYHPHNGSPYPPAGGYPAARSPESDILDAAGLGGAAPMMGTAAAVAGGGANVQRMASQYTHSSASAYSTDLARSRSQGARSYYSNGIPSPPSSGTPGGSTSPPMPPSESYAAHYQPGYTAQPGYGAPVAGGGYQQEYVDPAGRRVSMSEGGHAAGYPGYSSSHGHGQAAGGRPQVSPLPNPFSPKSAEDGYGGIVEASDDDESHYEPETEGKRVLKVANE